MVSDNHIKFIKNKRNAIIAYCVAASFITSVIAGLKGIDLLLCLAGFLISLLLIPIGYMMGTFVLGLQEKNPLCPKEGPGIINLKAFCVIAIIFFGISSIISSIIIPISSIVSVEPEILNSANAGFGLSFAAVDIYVKAFLETKNDEKIEGN